MTFIDTNVLVYAADATDRVKFAVACDVVFAVAAEANQCDTILTEDLNEGQLYCGIRAVNPFENEVRS